MASEYRTTWRDRLAHGIATFALTKIATFEYQAFVYTINRKGMEQIDREVRRVKAQVEPAAEPVAYALWWPENVLHGVILANQISQLEYEKFRVVPLYTKGAEER